MKLLFVSVFFALCCSNILEAQIEIKQNNDIILGPLLSASPSHVYYNNSNPSAPVVAIGSHTHSTYLGGSIEISCPPATHGGFIFENFPNNGSSVNMSGVPAYNEAILLPNSGHANWIGSADYPMWRIYTHTLYSLNQATYSDSRLKTNIISLNSSNSLSLVMQMKAYSYDYNERAFPNTPSELLPRVLLASQNKYGFLAEELREVVPAAVNYDEGNDVYSINYQMIIPILVEAIKEQQKQIDELKTLIGQ